MTAGPGSQQASGAERDRAFAAFIRRQTIIAAPPLLPEIQLHLATEITPLWQATEAELARLNIPPPFWAFAWAGGQGLARYVLDHPEIVRGRHILDFGAGSGLVAIAAMLAGAASATAAEIDPIACQVITLNAALNGVEIIPQQADVIGTRIPQRLILLGDVCYERPFAERLLAWLAEEAAQGATILMGDPGRHYAPKDAEELARYTVPTTLELEDRTERETSIWRISAG